MGLFKALFGWVVKPSTGLPPAVDDFYARIELLVSDDDYQNSLAPESVKDQIVEGLNVDDIPGGNGEFGRSLNNPIPVNGSIGAVFYLSRLTFGESNQTMLFHRLGSIESIDVYELVALDGSLWDILYFSMYHPRKSRKVPAGYTLVTPTDQPLVSGTSRRSERFPHTMTASIKEITAGLFGVSISPPEIQSALATVRFEPPKNHTDIVAHLEAMVGVSE